MGIATKKDQKVLRLKLKCKFLVVYTLQIVLEKEKTAISGYYKLYVAKTAKDLPGEQRKTKNDVLYFVVNEILLGKGTIFGCNKIVGRYLIY
jgi:hypothetical protein